MPRAEFLERPAGEDRHPPPDRHGLDAMGRAEQRAAAGEAGLDDLADRAPRIGVIADVFGLDAHGVTSVGGLALVIAPDHGPAA
jgi:hypothetical protein